MSSKKRIWAPILRRSQVRWDGLTKKQVGCPPTTNRIRFALPDPSDNARDQDGAFIRSHAHGSGKSAGGIRRNLIISVRDETGVLNGIGHFPRREVPDDAVALLFFITLTPQAHNFSH